MEMANNHDGNPTKGLVIVGHVANTFFGANAAIKFQFRDLSLPQYQGTKFTKRFMDTRLDNRDFAVMVGEAKRRHLRTMATTYDLPSLELALKLDIDILKIASSMAVEFDLVKAMAKTGKPIVASTAGLNWDQLISLYSNLCFYGSNEFAFMHCVALYPTPDDKLNLAQIGWLKELFPNIPIGYSGHEAPDNLDAVKIAYAQGARLFEKHIGHGQNLNAYSCTPRQINTWYTHWYAARAMMGVHNYEHTNEELENLKQLGNVRK
jgi:sialic acid synthase SpsE